MRQRKPKKQLRLNSKFLKGLGIVFLAMAAFFMICSALEFNIIKPYNDFKLLMGKSNVFNGASGSNAAFKNDKLYGLSRHLQFNDWVTDFEGGLKIAAEQKKNVIVDFYADWCVPCHQMDKTVFSDDKFKEMTSNFIKIKLDCTIPEAEGAIIKKKFGAPFMPYIIFYDKSGKKIDEYDIKGYTDIDKMIELINKIEKK